MTYGEVLALLDSMKNQRGIDHWNRLTGGELRSFGLGVTQLKKVAAKIKTDGALADELYRSEYHDARVVGAMVDDHRKYDRESLITTLSGMSGYGLAGAFISSVIAPGPFATGLATEWMSDPEPRRRRVAFSLAGFLVGNPSVPDHFFLPFLDRIERDIQAEENWVKDAMNMSLIAMGNRNRVLNDRALEVAETIGIVEVEYPGTGCQAWDAKKHLTNEKARKKFNV